LAVCGQLLDRPASIGYLQSQFPRLKDRTQTLGELESIAREWGFRTRVVRLNPQSQDLPRVPVIIPWREPEHTEAVAHFVVLYGARDGRIQVIDAPKSPRFVAPEELAAHWRGEGLVLAHTDEQLRRFPQDIWWESTFKAGGALLIGLVAWLALNRKRPVPSRAATM
jgi:ABC-type bacteriocin/lantibiotic exporter with double-glycine peptidase domain